MARGSEPAHMEVQSGPQDEFESDKMHKRHGFDFFKIKKNQELSGRGALFSSE